MRRLDGPIRHVPSVDVIGTQVRGIGQGVQKKRDEFGLRGKGGSFERDECWLVGDVA